MFVSPRPVQALRGGSFTRTSSSHGIVSVGLDLAAFTRKYRLNIEREREENNCRCNACHQSSEIQIRCARNSVQPVEIGAVTQYPVLGYNKDGVLERRATTERRN